MKTIDRIGWQRIAAALLLAVTLMVTSRVRAQEEPAATQPSDPAATQPSTQPSGTLYLVPAGRSPLAQEGENFDRPLPYHKVGESKPTTQPSSIGKAPVPVPEGVISYKDAPEQVGRVVTVQGRIVDTYLHTSSQICFLNFTRSRTEPFYVVIFKEVLGAFPESPDKYFKGKTIQVTGKVFEHKGRTQIRVEKADQIKVMPESAVP